MAAISLQALILHQYHRRISTSPSPAPASMMKAQAPEIVSMTDVTHSERAIIASVAPRETATRCFSCAPGRMNRR